MGFGENTTEIINSLSPSYSRYTKKLGNHAMIDKINICEIRKFNLLPSARGILISIYLLLKRPSLQQP